MSANDPSKDAEDATELAQKFEDMTTKVRETADEITARVKKLTDEFNIPNPTARPDSG